MDQFTVRTQEHRQLVPITDRIQQIVSQSQVQEGICVVYCPHTTAGIMVNENTDPELACDLLYLFDRIVPWHDANYRHCEGNTAAHMQAALVGCSTTLIIAQGRLQLGTWQGIFLAEFDGPRTRKVYVQIQPCMS